MPRLAALGRRSLPALVSGCIEYHAAYNLVVALALLLAPTDQAKLAFVILGNGRATFDPVPAIEIA